MKTFDEIKELLQRHKETFREQYGLKEIGIFGSYVRGEQGAESDLDILIELEKPIEIDIRWGQAFILAVGAWFIFMPLLQLPLVLHRMVRVVESIFFCEKSAV